MFYVKWEQCQSSKDSKDLRSIFEIDQPNNGGQKWEIWLSIDPFDKSNLIFWGLRTLNKYWHKWKNIVAMMWNMKNTGELSLCLVRDLTISQCMYKYKKPNGLNSGILDQGNGSCDVNCAMGAIARIRRTIQKAVCKSRWTVRIIKIAEHCVGIELNLFNNFGKFKWKMNWKRSRRVQIYAYIAQSVIRMLRTRLCRFHGIQFWNYRYVSMYNFHPIWYT